MSKAILTEEERGVYEALVKRGNMEDMFDFAYVLGRYRIMEELEREREKAAPKDDRSQYTD